MVWRALLQALACVITLAQVPVQAAESASEPSAQQLLQDMAQASRDRDFSGRLVYMRGNDMSTLEVLHARINGREYERLTHLDGQAELIRHGDQLVCVHPDNTITRLGGRAGVGPLAIQEQLARTLPQQYQIVMQGRSRVAGRSAWEMHVIPGDAHRHGYRLWIDEESKLMLRSELVSGAGEALERVEFITLDLTPQLTVEQFEVPPAVAEQALESVDASVHPQGRLRLEADWLPDGFVAVAGDLRMASGDKAPVTAQAYSDGLASFTVFVERDLDDALDEGMSAVGPTVALARRFNGEQGGWLVTLVGEVPVETAERVLAALTIQSE